MSITFHNETVSQLLNSSEASIRFRTRVEILKETISSAELDKLQEQIKNSERVRLLLSERRANGKLPFHPYAKWYGAHWVLSILADLRYPPGDKSLLPLRDQVYDWLFSPQHLEYTKRHEPYAGPVMFVHGLPRAHASMEGNALYYLNALGLSDERTEELAERLVAWQWPDGGWNCDKRPKAHTSSFTESLLPLRGLVHHLKSSKGSPAQKQAVRKAVEFFLERKLYKRKHDGKVMSARFTKLHYPCYWHYDILFGLKVMKEVGGGFIDDPRCNDAINLLRSKQISDGCGGFPAEEAYYQKTRRTGSRRSVVGWGGVSRGKMNEFVTCDALCVLPF